MSDQSSPFRALLNWATSSPAWPRLAVVVVVIALVLGVRFYGRVVAPGNTEPSAPASTPSGPFVQADSLAIGSCITIYRPDNGEVQLSDVDCSDVNLPSYTVVSTLPSGVCEDSYLTQTYTHNGKKYSYCLMENFAQDRCYIELSGGQQGYAVTECDSKAKFRVVTRLDGTADTAACSDDQATVVYSLRPQRTYCLAAPA